MQEAGPPQHIQDLSHFPDLQGAPLRPPGRGQGGWGAQRGAQLPGFSAGERAHCRGARRREGSQPSGLRAGGGTCGTCRFSHSSARLSSTTFQGPASPGGGLRVHSVLGEGVAGGCMSWGKAGGPLPSGEGRDSPSHENQLWGAGQESEGVQPSPPGQSRRLIAPSVPANPGRTLEEELEGSRGPTSQQTLPHLCLMGSRGGGGGRGAFLTLEAIRLLVGRLRFLTVDVSPAQRGVGSAAHSLGPQDDPAVPATPRSPRVFSVLSSCCAPPGIPDPHPLPFPSPSSPAPATVSL